MKRPVFLLITALASFAFGALLFFKPAIVAEWMGIDARSQLLVVLRGMGGFIIGSGAINLYLRNQYNAEVMRALLLTNLITHTFGLCAVIWGIVDGVFILEKMAAAILMHLFVSIGSIVYLMQLRK